MVITSIPYDVSKVSLYYVAPLVQKKKKKKKKKCHLIVALLWINTSPTFTVLHVILFDL